MTDATAETSHKVLDKIARKLNGAGCTTKMIRCDKQFKPLMDEVMDEMDVKMDCSDMGAHESVAEHNDRVIEEWHWTVMHQLPHKTTPKVMIKGLMKQTTKLLNMFPAKHGASSVHSPSALLGEPKLQ